MQKSKNEICTANHLLVDFSEVKYKVKGMRMEKRRRIKSLEDARTFFSKDIYALETTGIEIDEAREGYSKVSLNLDRRHENAGGKVMGGVYYTLADIAFGVAANFDREPTVTLDSQITFLTPAEGKTLYAEADEVRSGIHTCCYEVVVTDDLGTKCAIALFNGFKLEVEKH